MDGNTETNSTEVVETQPVDEGQASSAPREVRKGFVKHLPDDSFHEVDDVEAVLEAYPTQYTEVSAKDVGKSKLGWPQQD